MAGSGAETPPSKKAGEIPPNPPQGKQGVGSWKDPFQARGGLLGGFIQGRTKEVEDFILRGAGEGSFLEGFEMDYSRTGEEVS